MILFVLALREESQGLIEELGHKVIYTGVGKVNAAMNLTSALRTFGLRPDFVINLGTAGSTQSRNKRVVQITKFIQRDMLCEPIAPKYCTPFECSSSAIYIPTYTKRFITASCGTGDSFVKKDEMSKLNDYEVVDMEGFALARVCREFIRPFISLKYVTDSGEAEDWEQNTVKTAPRVLAEAAANLLLDLKQ